MTTNPSTSASNPPPPPSALDLTTPPWSRILQHSPLITSASLNLSSIPTVKHHLPPLTQSLISLAVSSSPTHLFLPAIKKHTLAALQHGATPAQIIEVLELTSTLGIHACNIGVPLLVEVMKETDLYEREFPAGWDEGIKRGRLREEFRTKRGYWHEFWEDFLRLDPEFFSAYLEFSSVPWRKEEGDGKGEGKVQGLEPKVKELIYCAFDAASTHLYQPGLKLHMRNALGLGATWQEVMEVLELASLLSLATLEVGVPVLEESIEKRKEEVKKKEEDAKGDW